MTTNYTLLQDVAGRYLVKINGKERWITWNQKRLLDMGISLGEQRKMELREKQWEEYNRNLQYETMRREREGLPALTKEELEERYARAYERITGLHYAWYKEELERKAAEEKAKHKEPTQAEIVRARYKELVDFYNAESFHSPWLADIIYKCRVRVRGTRLTPPDPDHKIPLMAVETVIRQRLRRMTDEEFSAVHGYFASCTFGDSEKHNVLLDYMNQEASRRGMPKLKFATEKRIIKSEKSPLHPKIDYEFSKIMPHTFYELSNDGQIWPYKNGVVTDFIQHPKLLLEAMHLFARYFD